MTEAGEIVYRIDRLDRISFVNEAWDRHAEAASSPHLFGPGVLERPMWDFITDATTRALYRDMIKGVRGGRTIRFPFRCDSPEERRFLEMRVDPREDGAVEFRTAVLARQPRPAVDALRPAGPRGEPHLRMCGWCKKVPDGSAWVEIEVAVAKLRLFDHAALPLVSHGICEECEAAMNRAIRPPEG